MSDQEAIKARFLDEGWIETQMSGIRCLAFATSAYTAFLTNAAKTGLPDDRRDWMLTVVDHATADRRAYSQPLGDKYGGIEDAVTYLPSYTLVCTRCGSDDIVVDACARWNPETTAWELSGTYDDKTCCACETSGSSIVKAILPLPNMLRRDDPPSP